MELDAHVTLQGDLRSPGEARRFVARTLTPLLGREDVETAMLVVNELVTNAALHAGTECELSLTASGSTLRVAVSDYDTRSPPRRNAFRDEMTTGRGLRLLEVLSSRWGVEAQPHGKTVWCELPVH